MDMHRKNEKKVLASRTGEGKSGEGISCRSPSQVQRRQGGSCSAGLPPKVKASAKALEGGRKGDELARKVDTRHDTPKDEKSKEEIQGRPWALRSSSEASLTRVIPKEKIMTIQERRESLGILERQTMCLEDEEKGHGTRMEQEKDNDAGSEKSRDEQEEDTRRKRMDKTRMMKEKEGTTQMDYQKECEESPGRMSDEARKKRRRLDNSYEGGASANATTEIVGYMDSGDMENTVVEEDSGKMDMITEYAKEIQEYCKESSILKAQVRNTGRMTKAEWNRVERTWEKIGNGAKKLLIYTVRERMNTSKNEEVKKEMQEMKKEMKKLQEKNTELEKEIARLKDTKQTDRQLDRETNYAEILKTPGRQQRTSTPIQEGKDRNKEADRLLSSLDELRCKIIDFCSREKRETDKEEERNRIQEKTNGKNTGQEEEWIMVGYERRMKERKRTETDRGKRAEVRTQIPTEALVIKCNMKDTRGKELIQKARKDISLEELGIENVRTRKTATGDTLIQMSGDNRKEQADKLKQKLTEYFEDTGIEIKQPTKRTEMRIWGLEEDTTEEDVREAVSEAGGGNKEPIRIGKIRWSRTGIGSVWVSCPITMADKILVKEKLYIGWARVRIEKLPPRQLQCYRCFEGGHTAATCVNMVDRSRSCFKCGSTEHQIKECTNPVRCAACTSLGIGDKHRIGGPRCNAHKERGKKGPNEEREGDARTEQEENRPAPLGPGASIGGSTDPGGTVAPEGGPVTTPGQGAGVEG